MPAAKHKTTGTRDKMITWANTCTKIPNIYMKENTFDKLDTMSTNELSVTLGIFWGAADNFEFALKTFQLVRDIRSAKHQELGLVTEPQFLKDELIVLTNIRLFSVSKVNDLPPNLFNYLVIKLVFAGLREKLISLLESNQVKKEDIFRNTVVTYHPRISKEMESFIHENIIIPSSYLEEQKASLGNVMTSHTKFANMMYKLGRSNL